MVIFLRLVCTLLFFNLLGTLAGQSLTQFNPKLGYETWSIKDEMDLTGQSSHSGQFIGFDVYVQRNRLLFVPGFHYHRLSILNQEDGFNFKFGQRNGTHYFSIPLTFGMQVIDLPAIGASVMAGGESTFFYSLDSNDLNLDDDKLYGLFASLTGVVQVELFSIVTLDVKYHYALHPIIKERPESKLRGWTLAAGLKF